jgi:hypothetical protein
MSVKQISVFLENRPGTLESMTQVLSDNNIDMRAMSLAETKDFGIVRMIVDDAYEAATILKEAGFINSLTPVIAVAIPDEPGGLNTVLQVLKKAEINIEYMYASLGGKRVDHAYMILRVEESAKAETALRLGGIRIIEQEELSEL